MQNLYLYSCWGINQIKLYGGRYNIIHQLNNLDLDSGEVCIPTQGKVASPPPERREGSEQTNRLLASDWSVMASAGFWLAASGAGDGDGPGEHTCRDPLILATSALGWQQGGRGGGLLQYLPQCSPGYKHRTAEQSGEMENIHKIIMQELKCFSVSYQLESSPYLCLKVWKEKGNFRNWCWNMIWV